MCDPLVLSFVVPHRLKMMDAKSVLVLGVENGRKKIDWTNCFDELMMSTDVLKWL